MISLLEHLKGKALKYWRVKPFTVKGTFSECISCTMKPVIFAHIYTFSRRFHPKRLLKEEQKQFVKEDDLPLCFASTMKPYAILCSCLMVVSVCLCIYGCEYAKQKTKLWIVEENRNANISSALHFYAIRILQIVPNLVWYIAVFPNICPVISSPKTFRCKHLQAQVFVCVLLWLLSGYDFVIMSLAIKAI